MPNDESTFLGGGTALPGKYLTFRLGDEGYGLCIEEIEEIVGLMETTAIPSAPDHIRGVVNLRGKVIPVVELRLKFGLPPVDDTNRTCIVVLGLMLRGRLTTVGVIVDEVIEVAEIAADQVDPPPSFGTSVYATSVTGVAQLDDSLVMLLDLAGDLAEDGDVREADAQLCCAEV